MEYILLMVVDELTSHQAPPTSLSYPFKKRFQEKTTGESFTNPPYFPIPI